MPTFMNFLLLDHWMFEKLPHVATSEEIVDQAFKRASKITVKGIKDPLKRYKSLNIAKITAVRDIVLKNLSIVDKWPYVNRIHPFYRELLDIVVGISPYKKALSEINWARGKIEGLWEKYKNRIKGAESEKEIYSLRREFYGRVASILDEIEDSLLFLINAREKLRKLPSVNPDDFCVVLAGYPNVGKSMLVRRISTAEPEIASYPFTTKGIIVGHMDYDGGRIVIVDTPGILDRPPEKMKDMEKQALLALRHLADLIIFLLDPTEQCGYSLEAQESLLLSLKKMFPDKEFLVVENKADVVERPTNNIKISALTGKNVDYLVDVILRKVREKKK